MKIKTLAPLLISIFIFSESFGQTDTLPVNRFQQEQFDKDTGSFEKIPQSKNASLDSVGQWLRIEYDQCIHGK